MQMKNKILIIPTHWGCDTFQLSHLLMMEGRELRDEEGVVVLDPEDTREGMGGVRHYEPSGTGVLTTWPHPIVRSGITHPVIVSSSLMSLADSGHVSGEKEGAGNCENSENARLICKGNEVDIKHGYCPSLNRLFLIPLWCTESSSCTKPISLLCCITVKKRINISLSRKQTKKLIINSFLTTPISDTFKLQFILTCTTLYRVWR